MCSSYEPKIRACLKSETPFGRGKYIDDERTGVRMQAFIDNRYPDFEKVEKLPCRFHMTADELKMILDPYFMEVGDDL